MCKVVTQFRKVPTYLTNQHQIRNCFIQVCRNQKYIFVAILYLSAIQIMKFFEQRQILNQIKIRNITTYKNYTYTTSVFICEQEMITLVNLQQIIAVLLLLKQCPFSKLYPYLKMSTAGNKNVHIKLSSYLQEIKYL